MLKRTPYEYNLHLCYSKQDSHVVAKLFASVPIQETIISCTLSPLPVSVHAMASIAMCVMLYTSV